MTLQTASSCTIKRALISVSNKDGILEIARFLSSRNIEILSTGGTYKLLIKNDIQAVEVSSHTQFPEIMDGRVKTLHPKIHGGILARRGQDDAVLAEHTIDPIDMVIVNLYPFAQTIALPDCTQKQAIENIDIGGPSMIRSAAKNHRFVSILVDPADYAKVTQEMDANEGRISLDTRQQLAAKAFAHTAAYDGMIANYFAKETLPSSEHFPQIYSAQWLKSKELRYGENPHQKAAFYKPANSLASETASANLATAQQHQGKNLSYNNLADTDAALETVKLFEQAACVIVKHANPCGVAAGDSIESAYDRAYRTDPESAFGGIIAFNRELDASTASAIVERQFVEVIIAPSIHSDALTVLSQKKNVRVLSCAGNWADSQTKLHIKHIDGGLLIQDHDIAMINASDWRIVTQLKPSDTEITDLLFAWKVAKMVKSNAIVYAKDQSTIGIGAGQMSRVNSARIAGIKAEHAGLQVEGAVMASDAFFPFRDGIDNAAAAGIRCVIQPGGSMRDEEVIAAADEHSIAMVFTGMRHFRH